MCLPLIILSENDMLEELARIILFLIHLS